MKMPIWNHRTQIGEASSLAGAERLIRRTIDVPKQKGFKLHVWERPAYLQEILGLPAGYVYAIAYEYK